jgi:hypothetical protein
LAYAKDIVAALRAAVVKPTAALAKGRKGKKGRKSAAAADAPAEPAASSGPPSGAEVAASNWGLLEPIHAVIGPIVDPLMALIGGKVLLALLLTIFTVWYMRKPAPMASYQLGMPSAQRVAAYEEMWRGEEAALWEWLEDRVGTHRAGEAAWGAGGPPVASPGKDSVPDMNEAIRVTESKLRKLKEVHHRRTSSGKEALGKLNSQKQQEDPVEFEREGQA